jgi:hypothetical protein
LNRMNDWCDFHEIRSRASNNGKIWHVSNQFFLKVPIFTWLVIQLRGLILLIYGWFFVSLLLYF